MKYYAICYNDAVELPTCTNLKQAIYETNLYFKSSLFSSITVSEDNLNDLKYLIDNLLDINQK